MAEQIDVAQHAQPIKDSSAAKPSQPKEAAAHRTFLSFQAIDPKRPNAVAAGNAFVNGKPGAQGGLGCPESLGRQIVGAKLDPGARRIKPLRQKSRAIGGQLLAFCRLWRTGHTNLARLKTHFSAHAQVVVAFADT